MSDSSRMPSRTASSASLSKTTSRSDTQSSNPLAPSSTIRPRNRKYNTADTHAERGSGLLAQEDDVARVGLPKSKPAFPGSSGGQRRSDNPSLGQFFNESWNSSWASIQGLTNSLIDVVPVGNGANSRSSSRSRFPLFPTIATSSTSGNTAKSWGPAPPSSTPGLSDVAAGSLADREAALKAAKIGSVLESHEGVNGGLDVTGRHKRRTSDDFSSSQHRQREPEDFLAYIHKVQLKDSYVGIVLRYKCGEDALRKANGLWSRDSIQTRKWLTIPTDACEVRGRPCEAPTEANGGKVDLLAATPAVEAMGMGMGSTGKSSYFDNKVNGEASSSSSLYKAGEDEDKPWVHVKWVKIEGFAEPVEIGRVAKSATGYFPPRRRKSLQTASAVSTPRQSIDQLSGAATATAGEGAPIEAVESSSRRMSSLGSRSQIPGTPGSGRSRGGSEGRDKRPAWMRQPGGVGSMGRSTRAPGPNSDYLNTWTRKHIPGLNIDAPSMSIMGSEQARIGFNKDPSHIAESSFEDGRDAAMASLDRQGSGLDKAAAAVETWLRGALSKRPSTPILRGRTKTSSTRTGLGGAGDGPGDLIELADTGSDDGRFMLDHSAASSPFPTLLQASPLGAGSNSRSVGGGGGGEAAGVRRTIGSGFKDKKAD